MHEVDSISTCKTLGRCNSGFLTGALRDIHNTHIDFFRNGIILCCLLSMQRMLPTLWRFHAERRETAAQCNMFMLDNFELNFENMLVSNNWKMGGARKGSSCATITGIFSVWRFICGPRLMTSIRMDLPAYKTVWHRDFSSVEESSFQVCNGFRNGNHQILYAMEAEWFFAFDVLWVFVDNYLICVRGIYLRNFLYSERPFWLYQVWAGSGVQNHTLFLLLQHSHPIDVHSNTAITPGATSESIGFYGEGCILFYFDNFIECTSCSFGHIQRWLSNN